MRDLRFGILGPLELLVDGTSVRIAGEKPRVLLALLLLEANAIVPAERIVEAVWEGEPPPTAANALQGYVSQLRRSLARYSDTIVTRSPGYQLALEPDEFDLWRFERLAADGGRALRQGEPQLAQALLQDALALWRGQPLADLPYHAALQAAIGRLAEIRLAVLELRVEADLALGHHAGLIPELERLVVEEPLRETLCGHLMLALYRSGRQSDALTAYQNTRRALVDELGLEPCPALGRLQQAILAHDPSLDLSPNLPPAATGPAGERGLLVVVNDPAPAAGLIKLAQALAADPPREVILAALVSSERELGAASAELNQQRAVLLASGVEARAASFVSDDAGGDAFRLATRLDVDLILVEVQPHELGGGTLPPRLSRLVDEPPCDVAVVCRPAATSHGGPVIVPFGGGDHEWAAVELGAWVARSLERPLRLVGAKARPGRRDASRLLADASLAVQFALGVSAEPILVQPGADELLAISANATLIVLGLPEQRHQDGLGATRHDIVQRARAPVALVRRGARPGGLAPPEGLTRYTWSIVAPAG